MDAREMEFLRKAEANLVATHRLNFGFDRAPGTRMDCKMVCEACGITAVVSVWVDDYRSEEMAKEMAISIGKKSFFYDCANRLAESVMDG